MRFAALAVLLLVAAATVPSGSSCSSSSSSNRSSDEGHPSFTGGYKLEYCVAAAVGLSCSLQPASLEHMESPVNAEKCDATWGQQGSVSWANIDLPPGKALRVRVTTRVPGQSSSRGFYVRPTRQTRAWGRPDLSEESATFYLASTGQ